MTIVAMGITQSSYHPASSLQADELVWLIY